MTIESNNIIDNLLKEKEQILKKRRETPKDDVETLKEIIHANLYENSIYNRRKKEG